jgi:MFS family permease
MEANATFPLKEMTILATAVFASAISLSGLFPYVGFMVISLGEAKDENEAGYFSGYIASAMMFGRLVSSFWWGQIADKWGRKEACFDSWMLIDRHLQHLIWVRKQFSIGIDLSLPTW